MEEKLNFADIISRLKMLVKILLPWVSVYTLFGPFVCQ